MKLKYLLILFFTFLFMIPDVNAEVCSKKDILRVKGEANSVTIESELLKDEDGKYTGYYNILIKGVTEDIYIHEQVTDEGYSFGGAVDGVITIERVYGDNYVFKLYYETCDSEFLRTVKLNLPMYNFYSDSRICEGYTDKLEVCDSWYQGEVSKEIILEEIEKYEENKVVDDDSSINKKFTTFLNKTFDFLKTYYLYIISVVAIIIIVVIIVVVNRRRGALE